MNQASALALLHALPTVPRRIGGGKEAASQPLRALCCDSRQAEEGSLFVCIRGAASDGHRYAQAAYEAGCRVFLVEDEALSLPPDADVFLSDDTRRDLSLLAAAFYGHPAVQMRMVGITGTKGKTSVAMMCYHMLKATGQAVGYIGTNGVLYGDIQKKTHNTTPGALELQQYLYDMQRSGVETVLLEVSSQALWQKRVVGIPFDVCALTNLYPDHIGAPEHPTFEHYASCKRSLMTDYGAPVIIGNADDEATPILLNGASGEVLLCGQQNTADLCAEHITSGMERALPFTEFTCLDRVTNKRIAVRLPLLGQHNVSNALFALAIARAIGLSLSAAANALQDVRIPGRFELIEHRGALIVIDYAHNGAALRAALGSLRPICAERLFCLIGSVGERTQCRRAELGAVADELADFTYLTADDPGRESVLAICHDMAAAFKPRFLDNYAVIPDRTEAIRTALDELQSGDVLLIAGKGNDRTIRIGECDVPHCDRDVVEAYIANDTIKV